MSNIYLSWSYINFWLLPNFNSSPDPNFPPRFKWPGYCETLIKYREWKYIKNYKPQNGSISYCLDNKWSYYYGIYYMSVHLFFFLFARHNTWQIVDNKCLLNERVCTMVMLLTILMDLCSQWFFYKCWRSFVSLIKWDLPYAALGLLLFSPLYHVNWSLLETNPHPCAVSEQYVLAEKITPQWLKRKGK